MVKVGDFESLWKVKTLNKLIEIEEDFEKSTVTRSSESDNKRALKFIEYGFDEGIKLARKEMNNE